MSSWRSGLVVRFGIGVAVLVVLGAAPATPQAYPTVTLAPLDPAARVTVVDTCPGSPGQLTRDQFNTMAATQDQLLATLGAVQTYTKPQLGPSQGTRAIAQDLANPSTEFGTIGMGGPWNQRVVYIEVTGTSQIRQRHADALNKVVPRPDRVVVCPTALGEARRAEITNALYARFRTGAVTDPRFYGTEGFHTDRRSRRGATAFRCHRTRHRAPNHLRHRRADHPRELQLAQSQRSRPRTSSGRSLRPGARQQEPTS